MAAATGPQSRWGGWSGSEGMTSSRPSFATPASAMCVFPAAGQPAWQKPPGPVRRWPDRCRHRSPRSPK